AFGSPTLPLQGPSGEGGVHAIPFLASGPTPTPPRRRRGEVEDRRETAEDLRAQRSPHALRCEWQLVQPHARERGEGVADRRGDHGHAVFAGTGRRVVG